MQFRALAISAAALLILPSLAAPAPATDSTELSCQFGSIWGAGDAACSASCIIQGQGFHGGHCDDSMSFFFPSLSTGIDVHVQQMRFASAIIE
jgi:hypothetical protein